MHFSKIASVAFTLLTVASAAALPSYNGLAVRQEQAPSLNESEVNNACDKIRSALDNSANKNGFLSSAFNLVEKAAKKIVADGKPESQSQGEQQQEQQGEENDDNFLTEAFDALKGVLGNGSDGDEGNGLSKAFDVIKKVISVVTKVVKRDEDHLEKRQLGGILTSALSSIEKAVIGKAGGALAKQAFSVISNLITNAISGLLKRADVQQQQAPVNATEIEGHLATLDQAVKDSGAGTFVKEAFNVVKDVVEKIIA